MSPPGKGEGEGREERLEHRNRGGGSGSEREPPTRTSSAHRVGPEGAVPLNTEGSGERGGRKGSSNLTTDQSEISQNTEAGVGIASDGPVVAGLDGPSTAHTEGGGSVPRTDDTGEVLLHDSRGRATVKGSTRGGREERSNTPARSRGKRMSTAQRLVQEALASGAMTIPPRRSSSIPRGRIRDVYVAGGGSVIPPPPMFELPRQRQRNPSMQRSRVTKRWVTRVKTRCR